MVIGEEGSVYEISVGGINYIIFEFKYVGLVFSEQMEQNAVGR